MSRITALNPANTTGAAKALLDGVQHSMGMTPNLMRTLAHSPAALEGYLNFSGALAKGVLAPQLREQIAIAVAEANNCEYCLSAHTLLGKMAKLTPEALTSARQGEAMDSKSQAALQFALTIVAKRGEVSDEDFATVTAAGYSETEIAEIIAHVGLNTFTNYFNISAQVEVDFPKVVPFSR